MTLPSGCRPGSEVSSHTGGASPLYRKLEAAYGRHRTILLGNMSRLNNLMIIVNISMFFLTGLVAHGYYFTFFSIGCLLLVAVLLILPLPVMDRLGFYLLCLCIDAVGLYFLIASIVYHVQHGGYASPPL